ncbi:MAG: phosphate-starvation-inducible protein PsiF [Gammaproteobacteria bacterium]|nr:phosphate-starvation-inducible protein PsiF [Gammaproteobacteria bacterium]
MKRSSWLVAVGAMLLAAAAQPTLVQAQNAQQEKMKTCNADAKSKALSGEARKSFMKTCLSDQPAAATGLNSQQEKMKTCNADAKIKALKGDARRAFMKECLSGSSK